jgi:hypothetical protein
MESSLTIWHMFNILNTNYMVTRGNQGHLFLIFKILINEIYG